MGREGRWGIRRVKRIREIGKMCGLIIKGVVWIKYNISIMGGDYQEHSNEPKNLNKPEKRKVQSQ